MPKRKYRKNEQRPEPSRKSNSDDTLPVLFLFIIAVVIVAVMN